MRRVVRPPGESQRAKVRRIGKPPADDNMLPASEARNHAFGHEKGRKVRRDREREGVCECLCRGGCVRGGRCWFSQKSVLVAVFLGLLELARKSWYQDLVGKLVTATFCGAVDLVLPFFGWAESRPATKVVNRVAHRHALRVRRVSARLAPTRKKQTNKQTKHAHPPTGMARLFIVLPSLMVCMSMR
jgi:hypothetical protein